MAILELRTIESSACAASGTTTLFRLFRCETDLLLRLTNRIFERHVDKEILALFSSDSVVKNDLGGKSVAKDLYLVGVFVKVLDEI
jgi:hypothetical protein